MAKQSFAVAYHEAGHAVVSFFCQEQFKTVSIIPAEDYLGVVVGRRLEKRIFDAFATGLDLTPYQRMRIENQVIISLAGGIAERRYRGRYNHQGRKSDIDNAVDIVLRLSGSAEEANAYLKWLDTRAHNAVNVRWDLIESVAQTLFASKKMTQAEVIEIILKPAKRRVTELK